MKIAYLVASHTQPNQVSRLVNVLATSGGAADVIIHHDSSKSQLDQKQLLPVPNVHMILDYVPCEHSKHSVVTMMLHSMQWIVRHIEFDWLVFLSGQDYPIQPFQQIERELAAAQHDGFLNGVSLQRAEPCGTVECAIAGKTGKRCQDCLGLYNYRYHEVPRMPLGNRPGQLLQHAYTHARRRNQRIRDFAIVRPLNEPPNQDTMVGIRSHKTPFHDGFECYKGSQWFTLRRSCIEYMLDFVRENPWYDEYYRYTLVSNESFFHSILLNDSRFTFVNDNKRFITWNSHQSPRPRVLTQADFQSMIDSGQHFARKFDSTQSAKILDMLDEHIGVGNSQSGRYL